MAKKSEVAITTLRRNIEKDSHTYFVKHRTHLLLVKMAEKENRETAPELDELIDQAAKRLLDPETLAEVDHQAQALADRRREEAEEQRPELEKKRASKRAQS